ncbi:alpha/beta hydrolase [Streptomyces coffeae]|uniref:alpha/beta hydrolase n=1 Tax=Streptomyces coffeae TaxID=621382 RepID=UPI0027DB3D76|nr:alpha/beta hydrolase [Streptomyces coffeae]
MVGDELRPPYDRPPLSKQVLAGDLDPHRTTLRQNADLRRLRINLRIYAAGDVANWPHPLTGERTRLEQRPNATQQAITAAGNLLAGPTGATPYAPVPFGWTDQYDARIQFHGWCPTNARIKYVDGDPQARKFVVHWSPRRTSRRRSRRAAPPRGYSARTAGPPSPAPLPFPSIVASSSNDPLGTVERVVELSRNGCGRLVEPGPVGHLNPGSGHGP